MHTVYVCVCVTVSNPDIARPPAGSRQSPFSAAPAWKNLHPDTCLYQSKIQVTLSQVSCWRGREWILRAGQVLQPPTSQHSACVANTWTNGMRRPHPRERCNNSRCCSTRVTERKMNWLGWGWLTTVLTLRSERVERGRSVFTWSVYGQRGICLRFLLAVHAPKEL